MSPFEQLRFARQVILTESRALARVADRLDGEFCRAVQLIYACRGNVIVSGMGKAGLIGQKIMATLASTGTPSHCLHPAEAVHGDLGRVRRDDVMLILSQSGETDEIVRLLPSLAEFGVPIVAITGRAESTLGRAAAVDDRAWPAGRGLLAGPGPEHQHHGDAGRRRRLGVGRQPDAAFQPRGFRPLPSRRQPGLSTEQGGAAHARPLEQCRVAGEEQTVREVLVGASVPGRRTGATMLVDAQGRLSGIFTDSDLARLFEHRRDGDLDRPIRHVMTERPAAGRGRLDDDRRRGDHGRAEDQRIAGGRCRRQAGRPDRHHRRGGPAAEGRRGGEASQLGKNRHAGASSANRKQGAVRSKALVDANRQLSLTPRGRGG